MSMPNQDAPVCLADKVTLDLTVANGDQKPCNSQKLSNEFGCAIAIDAFRFFVNPNPLVVTAGAVAQQYYDFGSIIQASIRTGAITLMQNKVHLRSLGKLTQSTLIYGQQNQSALAGASNLQYNSTYFECKLPSPLYLGRNAAIDITLFADSIASRPVNLSALYAGVDVDVAAIGRLVPNVRPGHVAYPYFMEYAAKLSTNSLKGVSSFGQAGNPQFLNPFYNPILLQKIVASLYNDRNSAPDNVDCLSKYPDSILAALYDGRGNSIAGYGGGLPLPLGMLVDPRVGEWTFERNIDAGQWINLDLTAVNSGALSNPQPAWFPRVALVGTHMEQFTP